jgi:predicted phage tail protein
MKIRKPKEIIDAISANRPNFKNRIIELLKEGIQYEILIDGHDIKDIKDLDIKKDIKQIDLLPAIAGSWLIQTLIMIAVVVITSLITAALMPAPKVAAAEATVGSAGQSFMLSSRDNLAQQGVPVPVGYGRLRIGSYVIQASVKSYPIDYDTIDAMKITDTEFNEAYDSMISYVTSIS